MSRKSAHLHPSIDNERDNLWALIRKSKQFTVLTLQANSRLGRKGIRSYLDGLAAAGYLERVSGTSWYTLVKDPGVDAPRVRRDGSVVTNGQERQQMWNTITVLKDFSPTDLAFNASTDLCAVSDRDARTFIHHLHLGGYLVQTQEKARHRQPRYMLVAGKWKGPKPPQIQRIKQIYDPNIKKVVWTETEEGGAE